MAMPGVEGGARLAAMPWPSAHATLVAALSAQIAGLWMAWLLVSPSIVRAAPWGAVGLAAFIVACWIAGRTSGALKVVVDLGLVVPLGTCLAMLPGTWLLLVR